MQSRDRQDYILPVKQTKKKRQVAMEIAQRCGGARGSVESWGEVLI